MSVAYAAVGVVGCWQGDKISGVNIYVQYFSPALPPCYRPDLTARDTDPPQHTSSLLSSHTHPILFDLVTIFRLQY